MTKKKAKRRKNEKVSKLLHTDAAAAAKAPKPHEHGTPPKAYRGIELLFKYHRDTSAYRGIELLFKYHRDTSVCRGDELLFIHITEIRHQRRGRGGGGEGKV